MKERYQIIIDTAISVISKFNGKFSNVVKAAGNSAVNLLEILT